MSGPRRAPSTSDDASPGAGEGGRRKPRGTARDRALRLLSVRARSRRELEMRLHRAGFEAAEVQDVLDGLEGAGLIDDERFAQQVVERATTTKLAGRRGVLSALMSKGVSRATAERALEGLAETEERRAQELASRQAGRFGGLAPEAAFRRLYGFLLRRGFGPDVARTAARKALGDLEPG